LVPPRFSQVLEKGNVFSQVLEKGTQFSQVLEKGNVYYNVMYQSTVKHFAFLVCVWLHPCTRCNVALLFSRFLLSSSCKSRNFAVRQLYHIQYITFRRLHRRHCTLVSHSGKRWTAQRLQSCPRLRVKTLKSWLISRA